MDIEERRRQRTRFMEWAFDKAAGSQDSIIGAAEFHGEQAYDDELHQQVRDILKYLEGQGLIKVRWVMGGLPYFQLTHYGIVEMEEAIQAPDKPTANFAPINVVHIHGSMIGSQLQQGNDRSTQTGSFGSVSIDSAREFLAAARAALKEDSFEPSLRAGAEANLELVEREIEKPSPDWKLASVLAKSARAIIESGLGGVLTAALLAVPWPHLS